ncbi:hypothetical protein [Pelagicoccus mobilis]|uniref:Uncharacterized protein n=1 Tax=Pelagicoccus mobilis TaxID=415221 RepID=A0A934RWH5_9BACT|nr:hypothetical protein [Pelagicoccus mobilis]MBK1876479.1 hypothetical protein [Pelagicoccus mobilis]
MIKRIRHLEIGFLKTGTSSRPTRNWHCFENVSKNRTGDILGDCPASKNRRANMIDQDFASENNDLCTPL